MRSKARRPKKIEVMVWRWKVGVLHEPDSRLPLAVKIHTIERSKHGSFRELVLQAKENLRDTGAWPEGVVEDRGFLDGGNPWWLKYKQGIDFVIPLRCTDEHYLAVGG